MLEDSNKTIPILAALLTVLITAAAQTCLKVGMTNFAIIPASSQFQKIFNLALSLATNKFVIIGIGGYLLSTLMWLYVLNKLPLSTAYPFVGLSILLTSVYGLVFLGETATVSKLAGILLISAGVILVTKG